MIDLAGVPVIDAHTHAFSPDRINDRDRLVRHDRWFGELYANPKAKLTSAEDVLESSRGSGISQTIVCGFPWSDEGLCREENAYLAEFSAKSNGAVDWLGIVVPGDSDALRDAVWCFEHGAVGLGEFNSDGQGVPLESIGRWQPVADVARAAGRPLLLHASEAVGHPYPGKGTATPVRLVRWLEQLPEADVVLAHWGGGLPFFELMPELRQVTRRVTYDCAASTYLYRFDVFPTVIDLVGPERVIWGSDFPVLGQRRFLDRTRNVLRNREEALAVLSGTAARVYRRNEGNTG
jgi:hypothetical protein